MSKKRKVVKYNIELSDYIAAINSVASCTEIDTNGRCCLIKTFHEQSNGELNILQSIITFYHAVWEDLKYKNEVEMDSFHMSIVQRCCAESGSEKRRTYNWKVFCGPSNVDVCRYCFGVAYNLTQYNLQQMCNFAKKSTSAAGSGAAPSLRKYTERTVVQDSYAAINKQMHQNLLSEHGGALSSVDECLVHTATLGVSDAQQSLAAWFRQYITKECDSDPARLHVFTPVKEHGDLFKHYVKTYRSVDDTTSGDPVSSSVFNTMWRVSFPYLYLRDSCNISGTCIVCGLVDAQRKSGGGDAVVQEQLRIAHTLHRPFFVGPRAAYHDRVQHALANKSEIFSVAIDIMESMNLQLPHGGGQVSFAETLDSNFVGVLVHGQYLKFYRTANTVVKTASLILEVFLRELDCWLNDKGRKPAIVYLQVDGGSENANKYLLALLEVIVALRLSNYIIYSRLPTQHSHDDLDGGFGNVKQKLKDFPMLTWESFPERMRQCFGVDSRMPVHVEDLFIIHNWVDWLEPHIDPKLANLHKKAHTQHQWVFESVEDSVYFPMGAKVQYRAHAQEVTIEAELVEKDKARSPLGKYGGEYVSSFL